jgi:hypothetical protein
LVLDGLEGRLLKGASSDAPTSGSNTKTSASAIAKEAGFSFPEGSRLTGVHRDQGIDSIVEAKVEFPQPRLHEFLSASPMKPSAFRQRGDLFGPENAFWDPSRTSSLRSAQAMVGSKVVNLGFYEPLDGKVTVLVVVHGT